MNKFSPFVVVAGFLFAILLHGCAAPQAEPEKTGPDNMAYKWGKIALEATANDTDRFLPRPTITSRMLGLIFTAVFDAWTRYDETAVPVYLADVDRRPPVERTEANKEIAISYAAFQTIKEYYFADSLIWKERFAEMGFDPNNFSLDPNTPEGIGNLAAKAVIEARKNDGSNHYGEATEGVRYADYTGYQPVNSPDSNVDIDRWQPKYFSDGKGGKFAPGCLTPYWHLVKPLFLDSANQFRPEAPPTVGSKQMEEEVKEVIELQANLTPEQKALVEFMRDGPRSVQQAGHWLIFAQQVSVRDKHTLDQDVKMYFLVAAAAMDAFIASWDAKMTYDNARPYALVHRYYKDQMIKAWGGPGKGMIEVKGQDWMPYSPETFLCPPFPAYVSGHSCVSGACSKALMLFTGDDHFGESLKLVPGALTETDPQFFDDTVTLELTTFTQTAEMAGISRVLGGYHVQVDNVAGLKLGRDVTDAVWEKFQMHVNGNLEQ
jgi:hypothetical protein